MTNSQVIKEYIDYNATSGKGSNLYIEGDTLTNYSTPIAYRFGGFIIVNDDKYSRTTSVHQNRLIREIPEGRLLVTTEYLIKKLINSRNQDKVLDEIIAI